MRNILLTFILVGLNCTCNGQDQRIKQIDKAVRLINNNDKLTIREFDANEIYGHVFDGGGKIKVYTDKTDILKIDQQVVLNYGRVTTIIYLENGKPIQIIDREENFKTKDGLVIWDYSKLTNVFEAIIYIFEWDSDDSKVIYNGERIFSEGTCSNLDYEPLIETVQKLLDKK